MTERTFIPASPACGQWETLLADALDGLLKPEDEATFTAHMAVCPACAELFEEARRGREWLEFLSSEPEVPAGLLERLLAATGPGQTAGYALATGSGKVVTMIPAWQRPGLVGRVRRFAEPRLMMTAAMAFFFHRHDAQHDRRPAQRPAPLQPAAERGALVHGAAADHGLDPDHPLLRPFAAGLRGSDPDARAAQDDRGWGRGPRRRQPAKAA